MTQNPIPIIINKINIKIESNLILNYKGNNEKRQEQI